MRRSILTAAAAAVVIACSAASPAFADDIDGDTEPVIVDETDTVEEPAVEEPVVDPIPVTPIGVEYFDDCGTKNDGFFFPDEEEGVIDYEIASEGWGSPYTVTVVLEEGYVLAEGATGVWEFPPLTGFDEVCEDQSEQPAPAEAGAATPPPAQPVKTQAAELAATGADGGTAIVVGGGALLLGGALLGAQALRRRAAAKQ
jgi:hypothetical protein